MLSLSKFGLSEYAENPRFGFTNLNNSDLFRLSFEDIFWNTRRLFKKKINPTLGSSGGRVYGNTCCLIAYKVCLQLDTLVYKSRYRQFISY